MARQLKNIESILSFNRISPMSGISPRDSDKELLIQLLQANGANLTIPQLEIVRSINFESVTRCRRKLQEEGKYPPSPEVARQRKLKSWIIQQQAHGMDTSEMEQATAEQPEPIVYPKQMEIVQTPEVQELIDWGNKPAAKKTWRRTSGGKYAI